MLERVGSCRIEGELASGGMAVLYRAVQETLNRPVAVKALKSAVQQDETFAHRFEREARTLAQLQHENLIHVYEFVKEHGALFIVMELVDGIDLFDLLDKMPRLPPTVVACVAAQIARALSYLHTMGVLHRDLKPANVLIKHNGVVKLGDFGIADDPRHLGDMTSTGATLGTPSYMSPEQIVGERLDWRSDQFSLGIVLHQMLAGCKPFVEDTELSLTEKIRTQTPPSLSELRPDVPPSLVRIVEMCLRKNKTDRFRTPEQLLFALERFVSQHVAEDGHTHIVRFLVERGLFKESDLLRPLPKLETLPQKRWSIPDGVRTPLVHLALLVSLLLAAQLGKWLFSPSPRSPVAPLSVPEDKTAQLLITADPWAHVLVDGQTLETTPFARPLRLRPGRHYLELLNPHHRPVRQVIEFSAGERQTLHVKMPLLPQGN